MGYLRLFLALVIVLSHLNSPYSDRAMDTIVFAGPTVVVKLFFIISGFYMAMVIGKYRSAMEFWEARALRLYPIYWACLALCIGTAMVAGASLLKPFIQLDVWYPLIANPANWPALVAFAFSNATFIGADSTLFFCAQFAQDNALTISAAHLTECPAGTTLAISKVPIPPIWTLAVEVYFYLMVPFLARRSNSQVALVMLASVSIAIGFIATGSSVNPWNRSFFPAELYLFLLGFLAFRLKHRIPNSVGMVFAVVSLVWLLFYQRLGFDWFQPKAEALPFYFMFAAALPTLFRFGQWMPGERHVGDLSYPVYISHVTIETIVIHLHLDRYMSFWSWVVCNVGAVLLASMVLVFATKPLERWRSGIGKRSLQPA